MAEVKQAKFEGAQQIAFGFELVDDSRPGPERLAEVGVSGYQELFSRLVEQGWHWKKAAFMAWRAAPRDSRQPSTQGELAEMLGYKGDKIFRVWLNKPEQGPLMLRIIEQSPKLIFQTHLADVDWVTIQQAKNPESATSQRELFYKRYRELVGETPAAGSQAGDDLDGLSDDELGRELARLEQVLSDAGH